MVHHRTESICHIYSILQMLTRLMANQSHPDIQIPSHKQMLPFRALTLVSCAPSLKTNGIQQSPTNVLLQSLGGQLSETNLEQGC